MNINRVYKCDIYKLVSKKYIDEDNVNYNYEFMESTLVYRDDRGRFIDLDTKKKYSTGYVCCNTGDLFVNIEEEMIPVSMLVNFNKTNMSRRRILKKYNDEKRSGVSNEY